MENHIHFIEVYFTEERIESLFFIIIGVLSIFFACFFLGIIKYSFFKGMAIPLLAIGLLQLAIGISIYNRSPKDIIRVTHFIKQEPQKIKAEELPRIEKVIKNFTIYKWIEIIFIAIGAIIFYKSPIPFWKGLALGLIIQASILLTLDIVAEKRADVYMKTLTPNIK